MSSSRQLAEHGGRTDDPHNITPGQAGADPSGTAASAVTAHEGKSGAHTPSQVGADPAGSAASAESAAKSHANTKAGEAQAHAVQRSNHTGTQTLATISDAGTAASRDVGGGPGNVLEVGQYGLGSSSPYGGDIAGDVLDELANCGFFMVQGTVMDALGMTGVGSAQGIHTAVAGSTAGFQLISRRTLSEQSLGLRSKTGNQWSGLVNITHSGNLVGDLSRSESPSAFEYGSNGNGEYLKFADGTLICYVEVNGTGTTIEVPGSAGSMYHSGDIIRTFPATFVEKPVVGVTAMRHSDDSIIVWGNARTTTGSTTKVRGIASQPSQSIGYYLHVIAIGRWR
ncbi:hypothetical protein ACSEE7_12660 [Halomonas cupida]|uniref:hypothetical protein n=1 Tax=Halomonas cupida TaxID=44933 RepID=UPI003EF9B9D0